MMVAGSVMRMRVRGAMFGAPLRKDERNARLPPILAELSQSDVAAGFVAHRASLTI
jgi:hypothetical protein